MKFSSYHDRDFCKCPSDFRSTFKCCWKYTGILRKVVGKNVPATTPKGNMGYDQYTVLNDCSCRTYFCCFPLALANICPWTFVLLFQIALENSIQSHPQCYRDCRLYFFLQPFSKQLYVRRCSDNLWAPMKLLKR